MAGAIKESKAEAVKRESRGLRGTLKTALANEDSGFVDSDAQLLKFHGIYQGYDRDTATARKNQGMAKDRRFMARVKIPGGRLTAEQYLTLDALADQYGARNLRITTRQGIQFHGLVKSELGPTLNAIHQALMTTIAACGDVVRNVTATPAPRKDAVHRHLQEMARHLSQRFTPRSRAYAEVWYADEEAAATELPTRAPTPPAVGVPPAGEDDPLYGDAYLPRKFKIGLATPEDNSIDVLANDLAVIALFEGERLTGYNIAVGGGLGLTHNKPQTYPRLASLVAFVPPGELEAVARAVILMQRDFGDRADRRHARLKYLVDDRGLPWIKATIERYYGQALRDPAPMPPFEVVDHMGWHPQGDGRWYLGIPVSSGRIEDSGALRLRTALRRIVGEYCAAPVFTATQDIILSEIRATDRAAIDATLREFGVTPAEALTPLERYAMACPALPTCGLALTEAERIRNPLVAEIVAALTRHGLEQERISLRITGCPNGCARPYAGEIGIVGRTPGQYALFLGGDFPGTRLNRLVFERVPYAQVAATLERVFGHFATARLEGETFGDFCHRLPNEALRALAADLTDRAAVA